MTQPQLDALRNELTQDPAQLGYAKRIAVGDDDGCAALLNNAVLSAPRPSMEKNSFLKVTAGVAIRLAVGVGADGKTALAPLAAAKWKALLQHSYAADPGSQIDLTLLPALGDPVADNILLAPELAAIQAQQVSRAQSIVGSNVTHADIAIALRG